jgi:hypothetical protein
LIQSPSVASGSWDPYQAALLISDGDWHLSYDGKDKEGNYLSNGIYLMEISTSQGSTRTQAKLFFSVLSQPQSIQHVLASPNPVMPGDLSLWMSWTPAQAANVSIYDGAGDLVRSFAAGATPPQLWDLNSASGRRVAEGVYMLVIQIPGQHDRSIFKLAVIR